MSARIAPDSFPSALPGIKLQMNRRRDTGALTVVRTVPVSGRSLFVESFAHALSSFDRHCTSLDQVLDFLTIQPHSE
jgi:hypothetical protein